MWDWEAYRDEDGAIDLLEAFKGRFGVYPTGQAAEYLRYTMNYQPIKSRQVAASALAMARILDLHHH